MALNPQAEAMLGKLAVHYKLITKEQLAQASKVFKENRGTKEMGEILLEQGWIDVAQLRRLHKIRKQVMDKQASDVAPKSAAPAAPAAPPQTAPEPTAQPAAEPAPAPKPVSVESGASLFDDDNFENAQPAQAAAPEAAPQPVASEAAAPSAASASIPTGSSAGTGRELDDYLLQAVQCKASDLHLHSQGLLRMRVMGQFIDKSSELMSAEKAEALIREIFTEDQEAAFDELGEVDFAYEVEGIGRFRANAYRQQRGVDVTFRVIPPKPPTLAELSLPPTLERFTEFQQGMVLLTGPMGCGKSATMAALVNIVNEKRPDHILTVEDPIEYMHPSKTATVNQRQAGKHTASFARALRAALREDPDVIVIGELRDLETISLAISAAETGHFVLGTLHTSSSIRTINRLIGSFPPDQQNQIRTMISESLRAVISQRLVTRKDGTGQVPALETLVVTKAVGNLIRDNKTFQISSILQTGASQGMGTLDDSLQKLVAEGTIDKEEALRHCEEPKKFGGK